MFAKQSPETPHSTTQYHNVSMKTSSDGFIPVVMAVWEGISVATSFMLWTYAIFSKKGMTMLIPWRPAEHTQYLRDVDFLF